MVDNLKELTAVAQKLNEKSNRTNQIIASINEKLRALNLGVEVWLQNHPLVSGRGQVYRLENPIPDDYERDAACNETWLGYCEAEGLWQLAVKNQDVDWWPKKYMEDESGESVLVPVEGAKKTIVEATRTEPVPLLKAARELRIEALGLVPALFETIKNRAEQLIAGIEEADALASKL